jgi:hypothetical protein
VPFHDIDGVRELNDINSKWNGVSRATSQMQFGNVNSSLFVYCTEHYGIGEGETTYILRGKNPTKNEKGEYIYCEPEEYEPIFKALVDMHSKAPKIAHSKAFHRALTIALRTDGFSYSEFVHKLALNPRALKPAPNTPMHLQQIQEIYNRSRKRTELLTLTMPR